MLNPIKAFEYVNSTIHSSTGFSFSQFSKKVSEIALPIIVLVGMHMSTVSAGEYFGTCPKDSEYYSNTCSTYPSYDDCINFCLEETIQYESFLHELGTCVRMCVEYYPL